MVIASSGEGRRRPSLQESVRSLLRQLAPPFYPPIPGRGPELNRLVDAGKSVLVVEHDLAVMAHRQHKGPVASLSSSSIWNPPTGWASRFLPRYWRGPIGSSS